MCLGSLTGRAVLQVAPHGPAAISDDPGDEATRQNRGGGADHGGRRAPRRRRRYARLEGAAVGDLRVDPAEPGRRPARHGSATSSSRTRPSPSSPRAAPAAARPPRRSPISSRSASRTASRSAGSRSRRSTPTTSSSRAPRKPIWSAVPGHYPDTALPGQRRTVGIAGHRTTYGAPFNQIDKIEIGRLDHPRDAVRDVHLRRHRHHDRRPRPDRDRRRCRPRAARADVLPPALQRRPALRGVRRPEADRPDARAGG